MLLNFALPKVLNYVKSLDSSTLLWPTRGTPDKIEVIELNDKEALFGVFTRSPFLLRSLKSGPCHHYIKYVEMIQQQLQTRLQQAANLCQ